MSINKALPGARGLTAHIKGGAIHSVKSPFPADIPILFTDFEDLEDKVKTSLTSQSLETAQKFNFHKWTNAVDVKNKPLYSIKASIQMIICLLKQKMKMKPLLGQIRQQFWLREIQG